MMQDGNAPFTARSVLASALLGESPPELPVSHLVHLAGLFGINENRARVALSRMVAAGEVTTDGSGRYRLAGHLLDRQGRQTGSRRGETRTWRGAWRMVVVTTSGSRPTTGRPADGVWPWPGWPSSARGCGCDPTTSTCGPTRPTIPAWPLYSGTPDGDPVTLAASLWDLDGWARRAGDLLRRMAARPPTGPRDWPRGSCCRPPCSVTCRPTPPARGAGTGRMARERDSAQAYDRWDRQYRDVLRRWGRTA